MNGAHNLWAESTPVVQVVSPEMERERLMEKSGEALPLPQLEPVTGCWLGEVGSQLGIRGARPGAAVV